MRINRYAAVILFLIAVASLVIGIVFVEQSVSTTNKLKMMAQREKVNLGLSPEQIKQGEIVDSFKKMETAGNVLREHRQNIAQTYGDLLAGGRYDPANPKHLNYAQAINLENYLYLGMLSFGVTQLMLANGAFMVIMAIALGVTGTVLLKLA